MGQVARQGDSGIKLVGALIEGVPSRGSHCPEAQDIVIDDDFVRGSRGFAGSKDILAGGEPAVSEVGAEHSGCS